VASTSDNDLAGSDITLGATSALGVALEAIDRLRVTASAHGRVFVIEVMGREYGYLGLMAGIAGGAEAIVIPETDETQEEVTARIAEAHELGKSHAIVVVAEGARNNADALARCFDTHGTHLGYELRITKLGHVQRGGPPCAFDRLSGSLLGAAAVERLHGGQHGVLLGLIGGAVTATPYPQVIATSKRLEKHWLHLAQVLAR
jgi:6-phosphofructokinase 1